MTVAVGTVEISCLPSGAEPRLKRSPSPIAATVAVVVEVVVVVVVVAVETSFPRSAPEQNSGKPVRIRRLRPARLRRPTVEAEAVAVVARTLWP